MTLRKIWLIILIGVAIIAIGLNTLILTFLTDRYFSDYLRESYDLHVSQITAYTREALLSDEISYKQMAIELESHINDPIIEIKLYDADGDLKVDVGDTLSYTNMMRSGSMNGMMRRMITADDNEVTSDETRQIEIAANGVVLGTMNITIHSLAENSFVARRFKAALITNSLLSVGMTMLLAVFIGIFISKKMARSLKETEDLASDIQLGNAIEVSPTGIKEINGIRESLHELSIRLKLKQKTRKALVDQLVHQTRTPLTILQSHLEAIEDGILTMDAVELSVCQNQVKDIKTIIANMSDMIDVGALQNDLSITTFEIRPLMLQIQKGLSAQFHKKGIVFVLESEMSHQMTSDQNKLSQIIYNLLTNAYKYTDPGGTVTMHYTVREDTLTVVIKDTGVGIAESECAKIFDAYYRSDLTIDRAGDGLGLYIVKENLEYMGGEIEVSSTLGSGTTFTVTLPTKIDNQD